MKKGRGVEKHDVGLRRIREVPGPSFRRLPEVEMAAVIRPCPSCRRHDSDVHSVLGVNPAQSLADKDCIRAIGVAGDFTHLEYVLLTRSKDIDNDSNCLKPSTGS